MKFLKALLVASVIFLSFNSSVNAARFNFPGHNCEGGTKALDGSLSNHLYYGSVRLNAFACPIISQNASNRLSSVSVVVRDENSSASISCALYSYSKTGGSRLINKKTPNSGKGIYTLTFTGISSYKNGSYSLLCSLPSKTSTRAAPSAILNYKVITK